MDNNYEIVQMYRDVPPTIEEVKNLNGRITKECKYYLMGKICTHERTKHENINESVEKIYARVGEHFNYGEPSMRRIVLFSRAIDRLLMITPEIVSNIIEGNSRLSIENTLILSKKQQAEILDIIEKLSDRSLPINKVFPEHPSHKVGVRKYKKSKMREAQLISVKDTPEYDPDAQILSLTYTIPSWIGAVDKVFIDADFKIVSSKTRYILTKELMALIDTAEIILDMIKEKNQ